MGMPYMGQSFPQARSGGGGGFAFRVFGGLADIQRQRVGHELTKDLIEHKINTQAAADLILGGQESANRNAETTHKEKEARKTVTHKSKRAMKETTHGVDEDIRKQRGMYDAGLETLRTMTAESRPGVDAAGKTTPPIIDAKTVRSPLEFQATGATPPKPTKPDKQG